MAEYYEISISKRFSNNNRCHNYFDTNSSSRKNHHDQNVQQYALKLFKNMIGASLDYALKDKSCCCDDNFLNRFLFARKFQCDDAMELLINYMIFREQNKIIFQEINIFDERIQLALRDGNPSVLNQRDRRGRKVITFAASNWDPQKYNLVDIFRAMLLSLDKLLENVQNQSLGFVVIVDWTNFTFKQSSHLSPKILKLMIEGLQDCTPAKFKGIHFIAQPWYVDIALTVIKPFLRDKIKERFMLHGTNLSTLHNLVSKDILPPDLGGEGPSVNTLDWYHYLLESSQTTETPKTYRIIKNAIYSKTPTPTISTQHIKNGKNAKNYKKADEIEENVKDFLIS